MCDIKRINRLKKHARRFTDKLRTVDPLKLYEKSYVSGTGLTFTDMSEKLDKVSECASIIELKEEFQETGHTFEQVMKIAAANFCKQHIVCPICADRLQTRRRARYNEPIKKQASLVSEGKRFAYIVTYTINDSEHLADRLEHLKESKKAFRKMGQRRGKRRSGGEAAKYTAAISTIEIKRGSGSGLWHVHSHDLVFTDQPIDYRVYDQQKRNQLKQRYGNHIPREKLDEIALYRIDFQGKPVAASKLSSEWFKATGGDSIGIDVEPLQHVPPNAKGKKKRMFQKMTFEDSIAYQAKEILKYPVKPYDELPEDAFRIIADTYNKRMVATYGEFRGVAGDDYEDAARPEQNTFVLVWNEETKKYGEPIPGKMRDILTEEEKAHETRSAVGKLLGKYRRQRKEILSRREVIGNDLHLVLDSAKQQFRQSVSALWSLYRQAENTANRMISGGCDKYSPSLALNGIWLPGSDSRDIYQAIFT